MYKPRVGCVVVVPVGPNTQMPFLNDTVRSAFEYVDPASKVLVIDNTADGLNKRAIHRHEDIAFLRYASEPGANPLYGGLYYNLSKSFRYILDNYDFAAILRLDDDALLIGSGADREAIAFFEKNPDAAAFGFPGRTTIVGSRTPTPSTKPLRE